MFLSFFVQIIILIAAYFFIKYHIINGEIKVISDDILVKDQFTIDKIGEYKILGSHYAMELELHNLGDMKKLDSIEFINNFSNTNKEIKKHVLNSKKFKIFILNNGEYLGVSSVFFNKKHIGDILATKNYYSAFSDTIKYDMFLILLSIFGIFLINFSILFWPLKNKIETNTNYLIKIISGNNNLEEQYLSFLNIEEYKSIASTFIKDRDVITKLNKDKYYFLAIKKIAEQVAHDIRSPLTAITVALSDVASIPEQQRIILKNSFRRIQDIAHNLLYKYSENNDRDSDYFNEVKTIEPIYFVLENIVSEKKYEYRLKEFNIVLEGNIASYFCFSKIYLSVFKRILSNLINNSLEAVSSNGSLSIYVSCDDEIIEIILKDNGCGISPDILPKITQEGFSFGKKNGGGFGLFHAKQQLKKINATLDIQSTVNIGTTVIIKLCRSEKPLWFNDDLHICNNFTIAILDDDPTIHDAWKIRFLPFSNITLLHFFTASDLITTVDSGICLYLIDYELLADHQNGLDLIDSLKLHRISILVTSCFEDSRVRERCEKLGVKIIPKPFVPYIPIVNSIESRNSDLVFIDNDDLMRTAWVFAAKKVGLTISTYSSSQEFNNELDKYSKNIPIYIDSDLKENIKGEEYAQYLYELGFTELYLATAYSSKCFNNMPWIKEVIGKTPPFFHKKNER